MQSNKGVSLSILTTVYKSISFLPKFIDNVLFTMKKLGEDNFEIIFVLDGITDESKEYLIEKKKLIPQIKIVELSRNFGHHCAISAGLEVSIGDKIFLIDCDLEVLPETLLEFKKEFDNDEGLDVVYGFQAKRKGSIIERKLGGLFWKLFNFLSEVEVPENVITERLMTRRYVNSFLQMGDKNVFLGGMMHWLGYKQKGIEVKKKIREGKSSYSIYKRINLLFEAITSFSEKPLKLIFNLGAVVFLVSILSVVFLLIRKVIYPESILVGYTSIVVLILFIFGVLMLSIGITGIYIARVFKQVQNRPLYIVKLIIE